MTLFAAALFLTLQADPAQPTSGAASAQPAFDLDLTAPRSEEEALGTWGWIPAGAVSMAAFTAGVAGVIASFDRGAAPDPTTAHIRKGNTWLGIGGAIGLLPGLLYGMEARKPQNEKYRVATPILAVIGGIALVNGFSRTR